MVFRLLFLLIFMLLAASCSSLTFSIGENKKGLKIVRELGKVPEEGHKSHFISLARDFLTTPGVKEARINKKHREYLNSIYMRIVSSNDILLNDTILPKFHVIKYDLPFCFSLPEGEIFFSTGLIKRYIKHETILYSVFTYEIIRSHRLLYKKNLIVPVGYIVLERLLSLLRLPMELKHELGKITYYSLRRAGVDPMGYLRWLQVQNKNSLDFKLQHGDGRSISKEEFLLKQFIVKERLDKEKENYQNNSSRDFYKFVRYLKKV